MIFVFVFQNSTCLEDVAASLQEKALTPLGQKTHKGEARVLIMRIRHR